MSNRSKDDCGVEVSRATDDEGVPEAFGVESGDSGFDFDSVHG